MVCNALPCIVRLLVCIKHFKKWVYLPKSPNQCSQIKLEAGCILFFCFVPWPTLLLGEAPFYWQYGRECPILLSKSRWMFIEFISIYVQHYAGRWLEFHFLVQGLPGGWSSTSSLCFINLAYE